MTALLWRLAGRWLASPAVVDWLIARGRKTPYSPIVKSGSLYMERLWLFNRFDRATMSWWRRRLPSIQLHWIGQPDKDRHPHDHPWHFRTVILWGGYVEERIQDGAIVQLARAEGDTASIKFNEYHRITSVSPGGVWTLFITGPYRGTWGFLVDGVKVPYRKYLGLDK